MISNAVLSELTNIVGHEHLITSQDKLTEYATDGTKLEFMPDAVAFPGSSEEISHILKLATKSEFPVIPRGAGSGMSGGALPVKGGLVMSMNRFDRILAIDQDNLIILLQRVEICLDSLEVRIKTALFVVNGYDKGQIAHGLTHSTAECLRPCSFRNFSSMGWFPLMASDFRKATTASSLPPA